MRLTAINTQLHRVVPHHVVPSHVVPNHGVPNQLMRQSARNGMKIFMQFLIFSAALVSFWVLPASAVELSAYPKLQKVANQLVREKYYTQFELEELFSQAELRQSILDAMLNPAEYKFTWGKYRKLFLQEDRIQQGVDFYLRHAEQLTRAEQQFGVSANMIVAIIGVESKYGKYKGKHKVLDSLVTLVVGFERRSQFFADELKQFLILTKENNLAVDSILGSYAGAVGYPQFISSSYRAYAVDFSGDGKIDLVDQPVDAIGSVANYFKKNGWQTGQPVSSSAQKSIARPLKELVSRKRRAQYTAEMLRELGAGLDTTIENTEKLGVLMLNASEVLPQASDKSFYLVRAGDTACQIAEHHNVSCKELFKLNDLNKRGSIFRGQKLRLPSKSNGVTVSSGKEHISNNDDSGKWKINTHNKKLNTSFDSAQSKPRYFYTHENFYVITRYNQSVLYAMAVNDLSKAIAKAREQRRLKNAGLN